MLYLRLDGDPILRRVADPIKRVNEEIRALVREMLPLMQRHGGVGLAAPQVGIGLRLFVLDTTLAGGYARGAYVNPEVSDVSSETGWVTEGCLSFPGRFLKVERPRWIRVRYSDLWGNRLAKVLYGIDAQAFLHELDHLNGKLLGDREET